MTLGYEQYLKNFISIEGKIGIIGMGSNVSNAAAAGVFIKVGPKFKLKPDYANKGTFGTHLLRGSYIRPELVMSVFSQDNYSWDYNRYQGNEDRQKVRSGAILINYGKQHVLGRIMTLDWHVGVGYGFSNDDDQGYYYGFLAGSSGFPIALSSGFTLGVLF